jgi:hypothetical protein
LGSAFYLEGLLSFYLGFFADLYTQQPFFVFSGELTSLFFAFEILREKEKIS